MRAPSRILLVAALAVTASAQLPRTADGKPDLQGIWQAQSRAAYDLEDHPAREGMPGGRSVVEGGSIPYLPAAAARRLNNYTNRAKLDPLGKCYLPGVPRIMYMQYPFQIFQTPEHIAITFEWSSVFRLIYTNGKPPLRDGIDSWMGDSRGHWDGDTLVVNVTEINDKTWFDMAGDDHSGALTLVERYTLLDPDTIRYEVTFQDPKTFSKPWKISLPLVRQKNLDRLYEYECEAESEEASGAFEREPRTWYPDSGGPAKAAEMPPTTSLAPAKPIASPRRTADGKPDISGFWNPDGGGANYGLQRHSTDFLTPGGRGVVVDPADGLLPYQPWAKDEHANREQPYRGYDDPTAHCFVPGVPRGTYSPAPFEILQPPGYVVILFERMAWRIIPLDNRAHVPDTIRLWQGDSIGHWEGDTLVVDTTNMNGKTWLNEVGDVVSYSEHILERFTLTADNRVTYRAIVADPLVYTRPWTIEIPLNRQPEELLEVACHEEDGDLPHLKAVRDEYRAQHKDK